MRKPLRYPNALITALMLTLGCVLSLATSAQAHEARPAVIAIKEVGPSRFLVRFAPSFPAVPGLVVHLPQSCLIDGKSAFDNTNAPLVPTLMDCQGQELAGSIWFSSDQATLGRIGVNVEWQDGSHTMGLSQGEPPAVPLGGVEGSTNGWQVFRDYTQLGFAHIMAGVDHLLFLLGLLLLVRDLRGLLTTISAFTVAHSITLAAAALGVVKIPSAPVEICIALSVLLLAVEVTHQRDTLTRRRPWLVAFSFGLLHGLGFASALADVGLPRHALASSLFAFNVGVELGQLLVVAVVYAGAWFVRERPRTRRGVEWLAAGALTSCSVFWLLQRVQAWLGGFGV
jgi:hydrogenase/urease accessory protein HupE